MELSATSGTIGILVGTFPVKLDTREYPTLPARSQVHEVRSRVGQDSGQLNRPPHLPQEAWEDQGNVQEQRLLHVEPHRAGQCGIAAQDARTTKAANCKNGTLP